MAKTDKDTKRAEEEMDEFDRLLQEFIESEEMDREDEEDEEDEDCFYYDEDDDDDDDEPSSEILNCPQFKNIASTLLDHNWELDVRSIDKNILHISKGDERFIIYLFYCKNSANAWLADEDKFDGEDPLWFSENSHIISPVFDLNEYIKTLNTEEVSYNSPIVVMTQPHYVINTEDMIEVWGDTSVIAIDKFWHFIKSGEDLDRLKTGIKSIGSWESTILSFNDFKGNIPKGAFKVKDKMLSWKKESETPSTPKKIDNDGIDTDAEDFEEIVFKRVRFGIDLLSNSTLMTLPSISTYFRSTADILLLMWLDIEGEILSKAKYTFTLKDEDNNVIACDITTLSNIHNMLMCLSIDDALVGDYWLYIKHNDNELYIKKLTFVDLEKGYEKHISIEGYGLFRIESDDSADDHTTMMERGAMSCFDYDNFAGVLVTPLFKNISGKEFPYQFTIAVENEKGEVIYENERSGEFDIDEEILFTSEVRGVVCPTGNYTIVVKFLDEELFVSDFVVGQRDVKASYKVNQLTTRSSKNKGTNSNVANPMKELESMIGLGSLKKQLRGKIAKIKLDQLRKGQGLPTKPQQLHMAFLGNPGTGKTTVAKILGQIYKDIGVLSKGHVVMEDRSTLMTQNWGGEGEMVNKALEKAQGGILFIDEAYDLITEHKSDPGKLIISALLQAMSDENRRDFMVIFAGYTMPMERLLSKNPGLRSRLKSVYFDDFNVSEMMQIADLWLGKNCYKLSCDARKYFEGVVSSAYAARNENFGNARYVVNLLENEVQPAMAERVMTQETLMAPLSLLTTIEACDIPNYNAESEEASEAIARLDKMVGLGELKRQIRSHLSYIRFVQARRDNKIETPIPPLHMVFTGNPGTGKTSVAEYIGDIYRSMGLLSLGNVIKVTRADIIDQYIGGTEENMKNILTAAHGNILFIDEAYTLFSKNDKDVGKNAIEVLLDSLGKENIDMIVILAGYPKEMEELLNINPGLKGRFPYTFNFEDYDEAELFEIAEDVVKRNSLKLTDGATQALKALIRKECKMKGSNFSNARFVVRLITTQVLPNMAVRLEGETDPEKLMRVHQRDIPIEHKEIRMINENLFDEEAIERALERLDAMVGLTKVKIAIHQFVDFTRAINRKDPTQIERYPLKWNFVGNTGTGKSSVAEVLSEILKAMHLLGKGHTVEVKAEELYGVATYKADELLQQRMRESLQGLLFVDGDAPLFRAANSSFNPDYLRLCLAANTAEIHGRFAVVIAEQDSPSIGLAKSLNKIGISNFDHTLIFDDYTAEELMAILSSQLKRHDFTLSADAATIMYSYIKRLCTDGDCIANARTMKELAKTIHNLASASGYEGNTITAEVVSNFSTVQSPRTKIGY